MCFFFLASNLKHKKSDLKFVKQPHYVTNYEDNLDSILDPPLSFKDDDENDDDVVSGADSLDSIELSFSEMSNLGKYTQNYL